MAGGLEGPYTKLRRAEGQLVLLKKEVDDVWPPTKRWPVRTEEHRSGLEYRFYLGELPSIDPGWLLWAGEIMFDMRSALDHLAYQLHVRRFRGRLPATMERTPMFPIFDKCSNFRSNAQWRIDALCARDQRAIKHLQPYVTRRDKWAWTRFWLGKLETMHSIDKHRKLHAVAATHAQALVPRFPPEVGLETHPCWGIKESHDHIETWTFTKPPAEMQKHSGVFLEVTLNPEGEWVGLIPFLEETSQHVRRALMRFANRFPSL